MNRLPVFCILLVLSTLLVACNLPITPQLGQVTVSLPTATFASEETVVPVETPLPVPTFTVPPVQATSSASQINLDLLKNFTYWVEDFQKEVVLADGVFSDGEIHSDLVEPAALGDLNGDGLTDAAVILRVDPSGSGTFYYLITLLNQNGSLVQAGFSYIGDRQVINNLQIDQGRIILDYITQALNDPLCCPSEHRLRSYLLESKLYLVSEQVLDSPTAQATPLPNAILIDQPESSAQLTIPLQVSGRVSQVPPEQKLAYYLTDLNATLLAQGEVSLEGQPGGPGTFAFEVTLDTVSPGIFQFELVDSAKGILRGRSIVVLISD